MCLCYPSHSLSGDNLSDMNKISNAEKKSRSVVSDSLWPHGLYSPWDSPGQNTGVGSLPLLQEIFPTQESNLGLLHCADSLPAELPGEPQVMQNWTLFQSH